MDAKFLSISLFVIVLLMTIKDKFTKFASPTNPLKRRLGVGDFGAYRSAHPNKPHQGQDFFAKVGQPIFAPFSGTVRIGQAYKEDSRFQLVEIKSGIYSVKLMYVQPIVKNGDFVKRGQLIGTCQDLSLKYGENFRSQNHIHLEIRKAGIVVNPTNYFEPDSFDSV